MKKTLILLSVLALLVIPTIASSSNQILTNISPISVEVNNSLTGFTLLNYNNTAYVPLRKFSDALGADVVYDESKKMININKNDSFDERKSTLSSSTTDQNFSLTIYSNSKTFNQNNENMNIWATFEYTGDNEVAIYRGNPVLVFSIEGEDGTIHEDIIELSSKKELLNKSDQILSLFPKQTIISFNQINGSYPNEEELIKHNKKPWILKPGKYNIGVRASFNMIEGGKKIHKELSSKIGIIVEQ